MNEEELDESRFLNATSLESLDLRGPPLQAIFENRSSLNYSRSSKRRTDNSILNTLYRGHLKGTSTIVIPLVTIAFLCFVYTQEGWLFFFKYTNDPRVYSLFTFLRDLIAPSIFLVGGLSRSEARTMVDIAIEYTRVSSSPQEDGTSLQKQDADLSSEIQKVNPEKEVTIGGEWESASTMLRSNIDEIIRIAENHAEKNCGLFLKYVDRLSRAPPLEACTFLWILQDLGVIPYFDEYGYVDLSDPVDQLLIMLKLSQSREEYTKIRERGADGRNDKLAADKWPADAPYGFDKDKDQNLIIKPNEAKVFRRFVELYLNETTNIKEIRRILVEEFSEMDVKIPSYTTLLDRHEKQFYAGVLAHSDTDETGEGPKIIPEDKFNEFRMKRLEDTNDSTQKEEGDLDHALKKIIERFRVEASLELFEDILKPKCPSCGGDLRGWGGATRRGLPVKHYLCENHPKFSEENSEDSEVNDEPREENKVNQNVEDEQVCTFSGPLLSGKLLDEFDKTVIITCPACQMPADDDEWRRNPAMLGAIEQVCGNCGNDIIITLSENKYERSFEAPDAVLDFFGSDGVTEESSGDSGTEVNRETSEDESLNDENQSCLSDYSPD